MHLAGPVLLLVHLTALVAGDTEIVNFRNSQTVSRAPAIQDFSPTLTLTPVKPSAIISTTPSRAEGNAVPTSHQEVDNLCKVKTPDVQEGRENGVDVVNTGYASCPGDTWVILNTTAQGWGLDRLTTLVTGKGNEAFTLRASWPVSTPAEVSFALFCVFSDGGAINSPAPCTTGRYAARVRVTNGKFTKVPISSSAAVCSQCGTGALIRIPHPVGLLFPEWVPKWLNPPPVYGHKNATAAAAATTHSAAQHDTVDVHLVLEPLLLGVFPRSLLSWLGMLLCVVGMGLIIAPPVQDWFAGLAEDVKRSQERKGI